MLTLPAFPPRRAWLWAFWTALSLSAGVLSAVLLSLTLGWVWTAAAPAVVVAVFFLGWIWPPIIDYPYRAWNKLAREFVRFAPFWVLAVSYYIVFTPVAWAGSFFRVAALKPGESLWINYQMSTEAQLQDASTRSWFATYMSWCSGARNRWAVWLLPFLMLLSLLGTDEQKGSVPSNIYTLY
jgi:hypothetical protein